MHQSKGMWLSRRNLLLPARGRSPHHQALLRPQRRNARGRVVQLQSLLSSHLHPHFHTLMYLPRNSRIHITFLPMAYHPTECRHPHHRLPHRPRLHLLRLQHNSPPHRHIHIIILIPIHMDPHHLDTCTLHRAIFRIPNLSHSGNHNRSLMPRSHCSLAHSPCHMATRRMRGSIILISHHSHHR